MTFCAGQSDGQQLRKLPIAFREYGVTCLHFLVDLVHALDIDSRLWSWFIFLPYEHRTDSEQIRTKAILFSLVKAFRFNLAVPAENIIQKPMFVLKPIVAGETGNQMPLLITPYQFT
jgi:hypothetical protein